MLFPISNLRTSIFAVFFALAGSALAQPASLTPTNQTLMVNASTGAIVGPISSANFIANNGMLSAAGIAAAYQPLHANLTAIAGLTGAADRLFYFNGTTTVAITTFTAVARQLLDDAAFADMRTTLGLGSGDTPTFAGLNTTAFDGSTAQITEGTFKVSSTDGYTQQRAGSFTLYQASPEKTTEFTANGIFVDAVQVATIGASTFSITGNAASATVLATARTIGNVSFNGAANIVPETTAIVDSSDSSSFVLVVDSATGNLQAKTDPGITYNSGTGGLTLTGSITAAGNSLVKNFSIQSGNSTGIIFGADDAGTAVTDATMKGMTIGMPHYTNAEEKVLFVRLTSTSGSNTLNIGGGSSNNNAITSFNVYTAASNTTTTGTRRGGFNSAGQFDVTATTSSTTTGSGAAIIGGGLGVAENVNAGGAISAASTVSGLSIRSVNGLHTSDATGTGNDGGAGSLTYGGIAPITFYVKDVPVLTSGSPADIATITIPAGITRWTTSLSSSTSGGGVRCSAWDFTATMGAANFTLYSGAGGTGTALTGVFTGPGSDSVYTGAVAASASTIIQSSTIYIRQTANSTNAGSCDFYVTIYPLP